jgi:hypothetical protein
MKVNFKLNVLNTHTHTKRKTSVHKETLRGDGYFCYPDYNDGLASAYISLSSLDCSY